MGLLQVSETRVRIVQGKVSRGGIFEERRGKHDNNVRSLTVQQPKLTKLYFVHPELNIKSINEQYQMYFEEKTAVIRLCTKYVNVQ